MNNPASVLPDSMTAIQSIIKSAHRAGVPQSTMELAHLRASQINGCSPCVYSGALSAQQAGESPQRLFAVAAWRQTELFTDSERAALALAEAMTRLADRPDPVSDEVWEEAARHFDEQQLAGLVLWVATTNLFNRVNAATKQPAGAAW
jgi:AhpD family alkylhydroperoxidase